VKIRPNDYVIHGQRRRERKREKKGYGGGTNVFNGIKRGDKGRRWHSSKGQIGEVRLCCGHRTRLGTVTYLCSAEGNSPPQGMLRRKTKERKIDSIPSSIGRHGGRVLLRGDCREEELQKLSATTSLERSAFCCQFHKKVPVFDETRMAKKTQRSLEDYA